MNEKNEAQRLKHLSKPPPHSPPQGEWDSEMCLPSSKSGFHNIPDCIGIHVSKLNTLTRIPFLSPLVSRWEVNRYLLYFFLFLAPCIVSSKPFLFQSKTMSECPIALQHSMPELSNRAVWNHAMRWLAGDTRLMIFGFVASPLCAVGHVVS